jgi:glyoxylase-like metal-dependent hydrolase (beta-lactamase superfamily II)
MKNKLIIAGAIVGGILLVCAILIAIGYHKYMTIDAVEIDAQVKVYLSGGGNSLVLTSKEGDSSLVVDTKMGSAAEKMRKQIVSRSIIVVNTHAHGDHTGGNKLYPGSHIISGSYTKEQWAALAPQTAFPDETIAAGETKTLGIGGETVHIRNLGAAHTHNDMVVYLENRKLLMTGDLVFLNMHPALFPDKGTVVVQWIKALDTLARAYEVKTLVPGHGPVSNREALGAMKEYFTSIRDAIGNEATLAELKKRYQGYYALPGMSGFEITVKTIADEMKK